MGDWSKTGGAWGASDWNTKDSGGWGEWSTSDWNKTPNTGTSGYEGNTRNKKDHGGSFAPKGQSWFSDELSTALKEEQQKSMRMADKALEEDGGYGQGDEACNDEHVYILSEGGHSGEALLPWKDWKQCERGLPKALLETMQYCGFTSPTVIQYIFFEFSTQK